jgi:D-glycero-D-manno-heptose 1,7-bisphosphate phosphatase
MNGWLFLDRDGVINRDRGYDYVTSWGEFEFLPGVLEALAELKRLGIRTVVITNQSCIGKGLVSAETVDEIHRKMLAEVQQAGGKIEQVYVCPATDAENSPDRKPRPGLLLKAAKDWKIDLVRSVTAGDSIRDLEAGRAAGTQTLLVLTGKGPGEWEKARKVGIRPDAVCERTDQLPETVRRLIREKRQERED